MRTPLVLLSSCTFLSLLSGCSSAHDPEPSDLGSFAGLDQGARPHDLGVDAAPDMALGPADTSVDLHTAADSASDLDAALGVYTPGQPPWGDDALELGHGRDVFVALRQGDTVRWEAGPQGGYHIWTGVALSSVHIDALSEAQRREVVQTYKIWRMDGTLLAETTRYGGLRLAQDQPTHPWQSIGQYAVLDAPVRPRRLDGSLLRYRVEITTPNGISLWRESLITSQCCD